MSVNIEYPRTRFKSGNDVRREIDQILVLLRASAEMGLHLGCGNRRIDGLINCDLHAPDPDRRIDCRDLSSFGTETVDLIETHHMVEHLSFADTIVALREWSRVLKRNGRLVMTCPDLTVIAWRFLARRLRAWCERGSWANEYTLQMIYGSQEHEGMFHRSGYDKRIISELLSNAGLRVVFSYSPYPERPTPSLLTIAEKIL